MMTRKSSTKAPDLAHILRELRKYRKKLQLAIDAFEALENGHITPVQFPRNVILSETRSVASYGGMQFLDAVSRLFLETPGPLSTTQISDGLLERGFNTGSDKPQKVIAAHLHRYAAKADSGIVRAGRALWMNQIGSRRKP